MKLAEMRAAIQQRSTSQVGYKVYLRVYLRDRSVPSEEAAAELQKARQGVIGREGSMRAQVHGSEF